jgi:hypothetical protein
MNTAPNLRDPEVAVAWILSADDDALAAWCKTLPPMKLRDVAHHYIILHIDQFGWDTTLLRIKKYGRSTDRFGPNWRRWRPHQLEALISDLMNEMELDGLRARGVELFKSGRCPTRNSCQILTKAEGMTPAQCDEVGAGWWDAKEETV